MTTLRPEELAATDTGPADTDNDPTLSADHSAPSNIWVLFTRMTHRPSSRPCVDLRSDHLPRRLRRTNPLIPYAPTPP